MTALSRSESKNMYSWWWDSHISPKNSKWLQENLTDMDSNVKSMIKIIEVDEDTFARRAEMYYKKRPELMKLVEEFYRAYRALAERYDHATGVIRQAHKTMAEAFPNQVPFLMTEDGPMNPVNDSDPRTPEMQAPVRAGSDLDELHKGAVGLSSSDFLSGKPGGNFTNGSSKKEFKQLNGVGKARKGLNFQGVEEKGDVQPQVLSESERLGRSEGDIQGLKESLAKLETEKQSGLLEYKKTLERLTKLESDFSQAKEDSQGLNLRANKAEAEVQSLKELLASVEVEREASLTQYRQSLDKIANLERHVSQAEDDVGHLNDELSRVKAEKEALLAKYMEALEKLANLENKLLLAEDYASRTMERAESAEKEVSTMKETIERLTEEKEAAVLKYEQSLEKIATLEREIIVIQGEAERLKGEVQDGVAKIKQSEETCLLLDRSNKSLQSEVDSLGQKVGAQNQELSEKQRELGRLWTCVQEERMRFMETEAGFQSLQSLHSKVQEDLRSVASELQKKVQLLKELEDQKKQLEDEVQKVKDENKSLDDLNSLSAISMKNMQEEIIGLKSGKEKLEEELLDQQNALQLEISNLKAELHSLSQKHQDLQDENSKLNENCQRSTTEISSLVEKLGVMERLVKKNELLENSMSDLSAELEGARGKVEELEESCKLLMAEKFTLGTEKGTLISQLVMTTENLEKLSQRNTLLENTLFDVNAELEMLRLKSRNLEDSCMLLSDRNRTLVSEKEMLTCELDLTHKRLKDLGERHEDLEKRYSSLEEERKSTLERVKELQIYLASEKHEHTNLENHIRQIQEEGDHLREGFEQELDNAVNAQFEIFLLYKSMQDLKDGNFSLLGFCEKLVEASRLSEKLISELEKESLDQQDNVKMLRMGMFQLLDTLEADIEPSSDDCSNEDRRLIYLIQEKLYDIKASLFEAWDENQELVVQKSVLVEVIRQLKQDVSDLNSVVHTFKKEIESKNTEVLSQQKETQKLLENNEELILKVREGNMKEALLLAEVENLREKLFTLQKDYDDLQNENSRVIEGNKSLIFTIKDLEDEYSCMVGEVVELDHLTVILKNVISEKSNKVTELTETIEKICSDHGILEEKVRSIERNLDDARTKNTVFELSLKKSENELEEVRVTNDQLMGEIVNGKDLLCMKEMELLEMQKEQKETEAKVRALNSELQKGKDEVKLWETIAGSFFTELQGCSVREALIKEKFAELVKAYEALEDESYSKCMDIEQLRERVGALEGENSEIKGRLVADLSAIMSLKDSVASLEKHTISFKNIHQVGKKEDLEGSQDSNECQSDGSVSLEKVQAKIQYVEKAIIELKHHAQEEYSGVRSDLDLALRQIEGLKSQNSSRRGSSGRLSRRVPSQPGDDPRNGPVDGFKQRSGPDTFEPEEVLMMKDIVLDQASDCSSYGKNRKVMKSNDHVLELWETVDQSGSIDLTVGKPNKYFVLDAVKENKSGRPSSVSVVERELGVDEQLSSRRFRNSQVEDTKRKTLERLASDVQKLTNLQITVRDLKDKLEMSENTSTKGKAIECEGVKEQLEESEQTILKLFDYSAKVMKNIENSTSASSSMSFDGSSSIADSSDGSVRRKKSMDQARRISEKIGRLQLEIQKIQFLLMKLDNNKAGKGGARIVERNTRVLLRDYLYGGTRTPRRRKKTHFCGCVQPATRGSD